MSALDNGTMVLDLLRGTTLSDNDAVPALAVALGVLIAEQCYPEPAFLSIVGTGSIIGAAAAQRMQQLQAAGPRVVGFA